MIRRAKNYADRYDKLFEFIANHYTSGLLYLFILLVSVLLVCLSV